MDISAIQPLMDWLTAHPRLSSLVIVGIAAIESLALIGIVVPGVALMLGVGALVGLGVLPLWATLFWAFLGAIIGDGVSYWLGHYYEHQLRKVWPLSRYPRIVIRGERYFKKHGSISVFFGRFIGPIRPVIPAVAGIMKMPPLKFYAINIVSAMLWAPVVILPGVAVGASINVVGSVALRLVILSFIVLLFLWFLLWSVGRLSKLVLSQLHITGKIAIKTQIGLGVSIILIAYVVIFVSPEPELADFEQRDRQAWWQEDWQNVSQMSDLFFPNRPIHVQWWTSATTLKRSLLKQQWVVAKKMTLKNAAQWMIPELKTSEVPIWPVSLPGFGEERIYLYNLPSENRSLILRLWPSRSSSQGDEAQLWLGNLTSFKFQRFLPSVAVPKLKSGPMKHDQFTLFGLANVVIKHPIDNNIFPLYVIMSIDN